MRKHTKPKAVKKYNISIRTKGFLIGMNLHTGVLQCVLCLNAQTDALNLI